MSKVSQDIGAENERKLLELLDEMERNDEPFPLNAKNGLYVKAIWARLSGQPLADITKAPSWFNGRPKCKARLDSIKKRLAQGQLQGTQEAVDAKDDALADLLDSASNKTVQMLKSRMNSLKEKLDAERAEKADLQKDKHALEAEISRLKQREEMLVSGKTPH